MEYPFYEHSLPQIKASVTICTAYPAHIHTHFELLYVRQKTVQIMIAGTIYTLYPGDCAVIFPGIVHNYLDRDEQNQVFFTVCAPCFAGQYEETLQIRFPETPVIRKEDLPEDVPLLLENLIKQLFPLPPLTQYQTQIAVSTIQLFFAYILPLLNLKKRDDSNLMEITQRVITYIMRNLTNRLSLDIIARDLKISKYKISKVFTCQLHMNFNQYVNELRISTAKKLLTTTGKPITTICYESGFSSTRTFNAAFYQITGESPKEYRQKYLNKKENF